MGTLGSKEYNYNFYGLPDQNRLWGTVGVGGYAALTYLNMWQLSLPVIGQMTDGIYWELDGATSDTYGKKLDETIALWKIPNYSSFGSNAIFSAETGNTLNCHYDVNIHNTDVPVAMCAVNTSGGAYGNFARSPVNRWAYDVSLQNNGSYSAMIYDIVYNSMCLQVGALCLNKNSNSISGQTLSSVASYINNDPDNRDVCVIRPYIYRGAGMPRYRTADGIPPQLSETFDGVPLIDTLSDRPVPFSEIYLRSLIRDGHDERRDDVIYSPFVTQLGVLLFNTSSSPQLYDITSQLEIGLNRQLSVSNLKNGATQIDSGHRITAQYYRCNYDTKYFSDVVYKWEDVIFDVTNKIELNNGFNLDLLPNNANIRFFTRLHILDYKGNTKGKALELAIKHEVAFMGMYFCDTVAKAESSILESGEDTGVYLPLFTGGVTNGEYVTGADIPLQPHAAAQSVSDETFHYIPSSGEGDTGDLTTRFIQTEMKDSTRMFGMTASEFAILTHWLNTGVIPEIQTETEYMQKFKNTNPADYVLSMRYYPFDLPVAYGLEVYVGPVQVLNNNQPFTVTYIPRRIGPKKAADLGGQSLFDFGTVNVPIDNDFRINYTKMLLYVPWCGYAELDPKIFAYSQGGAPTRLNVKLSIDYGTGSCMGIITRVNSNGDQTVIQTVNGSCGVDVPLFAVNHGEYAKTIKDLEVALQQTETARFTAGVGLVGSMIGTAAAAYSGNALGAFAGIGSMIGTAAGIENTNTKLDSIKYQIEHYAPSVSNISGASPFNNILFEAIPKLYIYKPLMLPGYNASVYGHTVGFACNRSGKLSDFSGLTVCASYDLSGIECTADEKQIISNYLKGGVIV